MVALVVGYGNPLRADDGLGWEVVERLAAEAMADQPEVVACQQLTPDLAERISQHDLVIFVDAGASGRPGRVTWRVVAPAEPDLAFSHQVEPGLLLAWSGALYGATPAGYLLTVDGADFGYGQQLSAAVQRALPEALGRIKALLADERSAVATARAAQQAARERGRAPGAAARSRNEQVGPAERRGRCVS